VDSVSDHVSRDPHCHRHQLPVDHQHPVVLAGDETFDDDAAAMLPGDLEGLGYLCRVREPDGYAAPVVGIVRLHDHRVPDHFRGGHRVLSRLHQALLGNRKAQVAKDPVGLLLIRSQLHGYVRSPARNRGLDPLLIPAVAELDQACLVEADPGDLPLLGSPYQGHGAGPERPPLSEPYELVTLRGKIKSVRNQTFGSKILR
jgi:hypothetical protein